MSALREKVRCRKVLGLIRRFLRAGVVLTDGTREATPQGVPQGGPLSPLLANIVLDPLDKELEARGHKFARYADDFIVLVKSARAAQRVMDGLIRYCEGRLKLVVRVFPTCVRSGSHYTTPTKVGESDWNRRIRSRMSGGVGPVADASQSRGPD